MVSVLVNAMVIAAPLLDFSVWKTSKTISDIPTELFKYAPIKYVVWAYNPNGVRVDWMVDIVLETDVLCDP